MRMRNAGGHTVTLWGQQIAPDGVVELPTAYCLPRKSLNGSPRPSIVEEAAPTVVPFDEAELQAALHPESVVETVAQTAEHLAAEGMAPAVAQLVAADAVETKASRSGKKKVP